MDIFALLMNAKVVDTDDNEYTDVVEVSFANGRLTIVLEAEDEDDEDPDDGEKEPVPVEELGSKIRAIAGSKRH